MRTYIFILLILCLLVPKDFAFAEESSQGEPVVAGAVPLTQTINPIMGWKFGVNFGLSRYGDQVGFNLNSPGFWRHGNRKQFFFSVFLDFGQFFFGDVPDYLGERADFLSWYYTLGIQWTQALSNNLYSYFKFGVDSAKWDAGFKSADESWERGAFLAIGADILAISGGAGFVKDQSIFVEYEMRSHSIVSSPSQATSPFGSSMSLGFRTHY
jgi:hypothetical protein